MTRSETFDGERTAARGAAQAELETLADTAPPVRIEPSLGPPPAAKLDGGGYGTAIDRAADRDRSRKFFAIGAGAAGLFAATSFLTRGASTIQTSTLLARLGLVAAFLVGLLCTRITPRRSLDLRHVDAVTYAAAAAMVGVLAVADGGMTSPLVHLVTCLTVAQGIVLRDRRPSRALRLTLTTASFVGAFLLFAAFGWTASAPWHEPRQGALDLVGLLVVLGLLSAIVLAAPTATDEGPRTAGRYVLEKRIGDGGMAEVWLGHGPISPDAVAVKVMQTDKLDAQTLMRFGREVSALSELRHPSTIRILDWGVASGTFYYVMELLSGETLHALVRREGPLRPDRAVAVVREVARAMIEAHAFGIVHRDLKPENIFVLPGDKVKVLDFGIAKVQRARGEEDLALTRFGVTLGTPSYMAPEQVLADPVDARTDIYGLGATLFFALSGHPPYSGTPAEVFRAHLEGEIPDPAATSPHPVSQSLSALVARCLQKTPRRRFASMVAVDAALTALLDGASPPESRRPPVTSDPPTPRIRRSLRPPSMPVRSTPSDGKDLRRASLA